jgi:hypothetical protein
VKVEVKIFSITEGKCCICNKQDENYTPGKKLKISITEQETHVFTVLILDFCRGCFWRNFSIE